MSLRARCFFFHTHTKAIFKVWNHAPNARVQGYKWDAVLRNHANVRGGNAVTVIEGAQGSLPSFVCVPVYVFRLHHSRGAQGLL